MNQHTSADHRVEGRSIGKGLNRDFLEFDMPEPRRSDAFSGRLGHAVPSIQTLGCWRERTPAGRPTRVASLKEVAQAVHESVLSDEAGSAAPTGSRPADWVSSFEGFPGLPRDPPLTK